jgi:hypothetical protein
VLDRGQANFGESAFYEVGCTDESIRHSRRRPYASAMDANDPTPKTNPTSSMAPKSHSAAKTIGTGSSKNLPYASPMAPANARAWGLWGAPERGACEGRSLVVVLLLWAVGLRRRRGAVLNMATRSPPSFSSLAVTRKIRYPRASILNLIQPATAVHYDRTS